MKKTGVYWLRFIFIPTCRFPFPVETVVAKRFWMDSIPSEMLSIKGSPPTVAALLRESQAGSHPCIITLSSYWQAWQRTLLTHCTSSGKERERGLYDLALIISDKYKYSTKPHKGQYTFSLLLVWEHRGLQSNTHQLNMKESRSSSCR